MKYIVYTYDPILSSLSQNMYFANTLGEAMWAFDQLTKKYNKHHKNAGYLTCVEMDIRTEKEFAEAMDGFDCIYCETIEKFAQDCNSFFIGE